LTKLFLGIDVGTFETKGVLVDELGTVVASASKRHSISNPQVGHVEQDADAVWWNDLVSVSQELMNTDIAKSSTISAMACSAIGPCVLPIDENLNALRPGILYGVDSRAEAQILELIKRLGSDEIFSKSGNSLSSQSAGPKIMWVSQMEPEIAAKARWYVTSQSYLVAKLTGVVTMDHGTAGYFHPLYDLKQQKWDVSGCEDFVSLEQLPDLAWATDIAGYVTEAASLATGIPKGTVVVVGTTDSPAEAVGAGVVEAGDTMIQYGSAGYMINVLGSPKPSKDLWSAPFVFPDSYVVAAGTSTAGTVTRWICDVLNLNSFGNDSQLFTELINLANQSVVGSNGLIFLPYLSGERTPIQDPNCRGIFFGLSLSHTRADLARAALEGVAHSLAQAFETYSANGIEPKNIKAIGGGTKNPIILESVSTILGISQSVTNTVGAAFGDAAMAAFAIGHIQSRSEFLNWVSEKAHVEPNPAWQTRLRPDHEDYKSLYEATKNISSRRSGRFENG
jgi:xylulokinase